MKQKYYQCSKCLQIDLESNWIINQECKECRFCHTIDRYKEWPSIEIRDLFDSLEGFRKANSFEYGMVACVFVSAALELLLERLLFTMAIEDMSYFEVGHLIDFLLDSNQGKTRRLQLYKQLGYGSFEKESGEAGCKSFLKHWDTITEIRNKSVHGNLTEAKKINSRLVEDTISEAHIVFSYLNNKYSKEGDDYQIAIDEMNKLKKSKNDEN